LLEHFTGFLIFGGQVRSTAHVDFKVAHIAQFAYYRYLPYFCSKVRSNAHVVSRFFLSLTEPRYWLK